MARETWALCVLTKTSRRRGDCPGDTVVTRGMAWSWTGPDRHGLRAVASVRDLRHHPGNGGAREDDRAAARRRLRARLHRQGVAHAVHEDQVGSLFSEIPR